jgi:hypothetical protein
MAALQAELAAIDLRAAPARPARAAAAPLLLGELDEPTDGGPEEGPTTLYRPRIVEPEPAPEPAPRAGLPPPMQRRRAGPIVPAPGPAAAPAPEAPAPPARRRSPPGDSPSARLGPIVPALEPAPSSPPRRIVTSQLAAQPDPLPRILDGIDPPRGRGLDLTVVVALVLIAASVAGLAAWLLLR